MKRIFFIDDDEDDRDIFQMALRNLNMDIDYVEAKDGHEALEMVSKPSFPIPDLIFVDLNMPRLNGLDFIVKMKLIERYRDVPTYVYTTSRSVRERVNALSAGANGYIIKHISHDELTRELGSLISKLDEAA